jgi:hypothetical protein
MIRESDLDTAVSQNIISAEQAAKLREIAQTRVRQPHGTNERFNIVNNLAEIFVSIGQVLFFAALFIFVGSYGAGAAITIPAAGIIAGWAMAEFFARWRNMRWPAIVASIAAALCAGWLVFVFDGGTQYRYNGSYLIAPLLAATVSLGVSIVLYRLPFLILPFVSMAGLLATWMLPWPREVTMVIAGAVALTMAVLLDLRDRERMTRNSAFAFWLYVAGAPMFLHPIYSAVVSSLNPLYVNSASTSGQSFAAIAGVLFVAAAACLFGLLLDRRSPIVASLLYLGIIIAWSARALSVSPQIQTALTLFILGVGVMLLGVWWKQARAAVLGVLPETFTRRLPLTENR